MDGDKRRACTNCARLKMKCRYLPSRGDCARCSRMKLECSMPENTPRRPRGKSTRVAQLEQKIDGLVSMLSASTRQVPITSPDTAITPATSISNQTISPNLQAPDGVLEMIPGFRLTLHQANRYLELYCREYMVHFPFVIIESIDAVDLYSKSPCLFWVIMAGVATETEHMQDEVGHWLRKYLSDAIIVRQERNIELLQAILLHLSWGIAQFYVSTDAGIYMHLAHTIVDELRLNRPPDSLVPRPNSIRSAAWATMKKEIPHRSKQVHSAEDRRALLGFYHISILVESLFHRGPALQWSEYITTCCEFLERGNYHPYDAYIVGVMKLQMVSIESNLVLLENKSYAPAVDMALSAAHQRLERTFQSLPSDVRNQNTLQLHYYIFLIRIYEPLLSTPDIASSSNLCKAIPAINAFYNTHRLLSIEQLATLPFTLIGLLSFYVIFVSDFLFHEGTGWDLAVARREIDFGQQAQELSERYEQVDAYAALHRRRKRIRNETSLFHEYSTKLQWVSHWYRGRVAETAKEMEEQRQLQDSLQWDEKFWEELLFFQPNYPLGDV